MKSKSKKTLFIILMIAVILGCMTAIVQLNFSLSSKVYAINFGSGTESDPFVVDSPNDLKTIAEDVNAGLKNGYYGVYFVLGGDIDLSQISNEVSPDLGFAPIGTKLYPFKGSFNGNGFTVNNLFINREETEYIGLFGFTNVNATIKNLTVSGNVKGASFTAGIVGHNKGKIENCNNIALINAVDNSMHVGGICGYNEGDISNSSNQADLSFGFVSFVGGVAGNNLGTIINSYNMGSLSTTESIIGGVVGYNELNAGLNNVFNCGEISGDSVVGGVSGGNNTTIKNAYNTGIITSDNGTAGGVVGNNEVLGEISYVYNTANVLGRNTIAGLVGFNSGILQKGVFNRDSFDGVASREGVIIDCFSLTAREMVHADTLANVDKLAVLTNDNDNVWCKRDSDLNAYYPELFALKDSKVNDSKYSAKMNRVALSENQISLSEVEFIYNASENEPTVFLGAMQLVIGLDYDVVFLNNVNAGTAQAEITLKGYFSGVITKTFEIKKALLKVDFAGFEYIYNASLQHPIVSAVSGNFQDGIVFDYIYDGSVDAGEYSMQVVLKDDLVNANYYLPKTIIQYKIKKVNLSIEWSSDKFIYNGAEQVPSIVRVNGLVNNEIAVFSFNFKTNKVDAGKHNIIVTLDSNTKTNINYSLNESEIAYHISKRDISVVFDETKLYYNGKAQFPTAELSEGLLNSDVVNFIYSRYENNINANEKDGYYVYLTIDNTNYNLDILYNYFIHRAPIKIEWWQAPLLYNGKAQAPSFYVSGGRIENEDILFDISDYSGNINASQNADYQIAIQLNDNQVSNNYFFEPTVKSYEIQKAIFDINQVNFANQVFGFDGQMKSIVISSQLPIGVSVRYDNNNATQIGAYSAVAIFSIDEANYVPLQNNTLSAIMYITNKSFYSSDDLVNVEFNDNLIYGATLRIKESTDNSHFDMNGKSKMYAYSLVYDGTTYNGDLTIRVSLDKNQLSEKNLFVIYRNTAGEIIVADCQLINGQIVFLAKNVVDFIVLKDTNLIWLWIVLPIIVLILFGGVFYILLVKKRRGLLRVANTESNRSAANMQGIVSSDGNVENVACNNLEEPKDFIEKLMNVQDFIFEGVQCKSFDAFLKSLNFKSIDKQVLVCQGSLETLMLKESMPHNTLYWNGKRLRKDSKAWFDCVSKIGMELGISAIPSQQICVELMHIAKESIK